MNKILTLSLFTLAFTFGYSQEESTSEVEETSSSDEKKEKKKKRDDADIFIGEPEDSEDYKIDNRREISKPLMPFLDIDQEFNSQKKKKTQQNSFIENSYFFPAKPKHAWTIGINGGISSINGDVSSNYFRGAKPFVPGYTFGAYVKKPISYLFSLRASYHYMEMWNTDWKMTTLTNELRGKTGLEEYNAGTRFFNNSTTVSHDATLDAIFTFGNVKFHKERSKVVFNVFISGGGFIYRTWMDHLDDDGNPYDYSSIAPVGGDVTKRDVLKQLQELRNGTYETAAEGSPESRNPNILGGYNFRPVMGAGFGFTFRLSRIVDLDLESRVMFTRDDLVDGIQWQEPTPGSNTADSRGMTRDYDSYMTTTLGLNFKLVGKKKTEPLTLLNPMHYTYSKLAEADPDRVLNELMKDEDGDGVPDLWDEEPDTPDGAPVDPKGKALDSDGDGIIDLNDLEPFSQPGYPVDENGVAIIPEPDNKGVLADAICDQMETFPSIHFDKDYYYIIPEFYAHIHIIAEKLILCEDMKLIAIGTADIDNYDEYNFQLSWNRVNKIISYLEDNYSIDRNRFYIEYVGETESSAPRSNPVQQYKERRVYFKVAEDNYDGKANPPAPYPNIKAGSD